MHLFPYAYINREKEVSPVPLEGKDSVAYLDPQAQMASLENVVAQVTQDAQEPQASLVHQERRVSA